jgi:hypothetical protein
MGDGAWARAGIAQTPPRTKDKGQRTKNKEPRLVIATNLQ